MQIPPKKTIDSNQLTSERFNVPEMALTKAVQALMVALLRQDAQELCEDSPDPQLYRDCMDVAPHEVPVILKLTDDFVHLDFCASPLPKMEVEEELEKKVRKALPGEEQRQLFDDITRRDADSRLNQMADVFEIIVLNDLKNRCPTECVEWDGGYAFRRDEFVQVIHDFMQEEQAELQALHDELGTPTSLDLALFDARSAAKAV